MDSLNLSILQTFRAGLDKNDYKNLGTYSICSKCGIALTGENYKKK